jgi:hypothetical protein
MNELMKIKNQVAPNKPRDDDSNSISYNNFNLLDNKSSSEESEDKKLKNNNEIDKYIDNNINSQGKYESNFNVDFNFNQNVPAEFEVDEEINHEHSVITEKNKLKIEDVVIVIEEKENAAPHQQNKTNRPRFAIGHKLSIK